MQTASSVHPAIKRAASRIRSDKTGDLYRPAIDLRGAAAALFDNQQDREILISGPAGTGKSRACLEKLHYIAQRYAGCRLLTLRKTRASLTESALVTFEEKVLGGNHPLAIGLQRRTRQTYLYPNGSRIVVGGLDQPTRLFSTEFDLIYVQEATELELNDWESLLRCLRNNRLPFQQLIADCNPDAPGHWLKQRCDAETTLYLESHHEDNPLLYDAGDWTDAGREYLSVLEAMTGVRKERLRYGKWVQAEGAIYDNWSNANISSAEATYDPALSVLWFCDDGYMNPRVILIAQVRKDGTVLILDEYYESHQLVGSSLNNVLARPYRKPALAIYDPAATSLAAEIRQHGIQTMAANNNVADGIKVVRDYLCDGNGVHSLFVHPQCVKLIGEIPAYHYATTQQAKGGDAPPVKSNDHACDALRYGLATRHGLSTPRGGYPIGR